MITFPIEIQRNYYRGRDPRKMAKAAEENRIAAALEDHINRLLQAQQEPIKVYRYYEIARDTGFSLETVRRLCFSIDCGHNGFTAYKSEETVG